MPKINKIKIRNFRSIKNISLDVDELSVIVGNNDCGKSNIFRALNLFFNGKTDGTQEFDFNVDFNRYVETPKKASEITIELELALPPNYHKTNGDVVIWKKTWRKGGLWASKSGYKGYIKIINRLGRTKLEEKRIPAKSNVHSLLEKIEFEYIPAIRSSDYIRSLRGRIYGIISQLTEANFREKSKDFETAISENVSTLIKDIDADLGENTSLKLPNDLSDVFKSLDFLSGEKSISLNQRGDGIKGRYIPLILKFMADKKSELQNKGASPHTFIWAYEEPENNLEYSRAQELADLFCRMASDSDIQILLTTHSPVFYNLNSVNDICNLNYIKNNLEGGTQLIPASINSLDLEMGTLPIIAPYLQNAQQEIDSLQEQLTNTKEQLQGQNKPVIFIEGPSDFILYKKIIEYHFTAAEISRILLMEPPKRAGANYVVNMLKAWENSTKHKPLADREKALGIVDNDQEGLDALERFTSEFRDKNKHVRLVNYSTPDHLKQLVDVGFTIPVCLEELLPPDQWAHANQQGWLIERHKSSICSKSLYDKAHIEEKHPSAYIEDDWRLYCEMKPNPDNKTEWASHIINLTDVQFEAATSHIAFWLKEELVKTGAFAT